MAFLKSSSARVLNPNVKPSSWIGRVADPRKKTASDELAKFDSSKWLLSHVTIMASVDVENEVPGDPKKNWKIIPEHSMFVNNNGDAWERKLLARTYGTFLGANNYVEHNQVIALAKGKVIDTALREVTLGKRMDGTPITTLYVDILIATSWEHEDLCRKILSGEYNAVSMGCSCKYTICSRCGNIAHDETELCEHVKYYRRQSYYDDSGVQRVIAELCGSADDPSSVVFVDASWVRNPAFPGAVLQSILNPPVLPTNMEVPTASFSPIAPGKAISLESMFYGVPKAESSVAPKPTGYTVAQDALLASLAGRVTTQTKHHETMLKAASETDLLDSVSREVLAAEGDTPEGAAAAEGEAATRFSLGEDTPPAEDAGSGLDSLLGGEPPAEDAPPAGDTPPAEDAPPAGNEPPSPEAVNTPLDTIKDQVRDSILNQIKQDLMTGAKEMSGDAPSPYDSADTSDSLMKYAAAATSRKNLISLWNKKAVDASKIRDKKIAGALLMLNIAPLQKLASFGYKAPDLLKVLNYLDARGGKPAVGSDAVKYIGVKLASAPTFMDKMASENDKRVKFFQDFIVLAGRTPRGQEAQKMWSWYALASGLPRN